MNHRLLLVQLCTAAKPVCLYGFGLLILFQRKPLQYRQWSFRKNWALLAMKRHFRLHKLRGAMVRPCRDKIGTEWPIELDIIFIGGKTRSGIQGKTNQAPVIIAVEIRRREVRDPKTRKVVKRAIAGRLRVQKLPNKKAVSVDQFTRNCIVPGAAIISDDGTEFTNLSNLGFDHQPVPMRGDRVKMDSTLPMVSLVTANLKTWIDGTFHGVRKKHLQAYLDEFMFRFNRRFYRSVSFRSLLGIGTLNTGITYKEVYAVLDPTINDETSIM